MFTIVASHNRGSENSVWNEEWTGRSVKIPEVMGKCWSRGSGRSKGEGICRNARLKGSALQLFVMKEDLEGGTKVPGASETLPLVAVWAGAECWYFLNAMRWLFTNHGKRRPLSGFQVEYEWLTSDPLFSIHQTLLRARCYPWDWWHTSERKRHKTLPLAKCS